MLTTENTKKTQSQKQLSIKWVGLISFADAVAYQHRVQKVVEAQGGGVLLGLEHPPTITLGKSSVLEDDLLVPQSELDEKKIDLIHVDRGGRATVHSPGQLIIYPILPLRTWNLGVRDYLWSLEEATIRTLKDFEIQAHRGATEPGIYTERGKMAFFGVRINRGISRHGVAINLYNDLELFKNIISCGQQSEKFDRLLDHGIQLPPDQLFTRWVKNLVSVLDLTVGPINISV